MRRLLPLISLLIVFAVVFWLARGVGWDTLAREQSVLLDMVREKPVQTALIYLVVYFFTAALSLPNGVLITVVGGLLFGPVEGTLLTAIGATAGACALLVLLRTILAGTLERQRARIPAFMRAKLQRDGLRYLLALRFLPLFPFWIVNLAAVVAGLPLRTFFFGTLVGILPVTFVFASLGAGIGDVLAAGERPDLTIVFQPHILLPLVGLAVLILLPTVMRRRSAHA